MERGTWRAVVCGVSKSQTWLSDYAQHSEHVTEIKVNAIGSSWPLAAELQRA